MDPDQRIHVRGIITLARFFLDEDIGSELATLLRIAGHDVLSTGEAGLRSNPDSDQLLHAWLDQRIVVTHNSDDFFLLHLAWTDWPVAWATNPIPRHAGIAVIRQPPRLSHADAAIALSDLAASGMPIINDIVSLSHSREWVPMRWRRPR
jgi:hypothetical protein